MVVSMSLMGENSDSRLEVWHDIQRELIGHRPNRMAAFIKARTKGDMYEHSSIKIGMRKKLT